MASLGKILHNEKRKEWSEKAYQSRAELKKQIANPELDMDAKILLIQKLDRNKNASMTRYRRRCIITGRPRGVTYGSIGRSMFRQLANEGRLPGVRKASW